MADKDELQKIAEQAEKAKHVARVVQRAINEVGRAMDPGRETSLAITKLEEAGFWASAGVARGL